MLISLRLINLSLSTKAHLTFKYYYANNKLLRIAYDDRYAARINVYCFKQLKKKRERERKIVAWIIKTGFNVRFSYCLDIEC